MKNLLLLLVLTLSLQLVAQQKPGVPYVPLNKKLDAQWVQSLFQKGDQKVYKRNELAHISMPCGGIGPARLK